MVWSAPLSRCLRIDIFKSTTPSLPHLPCFRVLGGAVGARILSKSASGTASKSFALVVLVHLHCSKGPLFVHEPRARVVVDNEIAFSAHAYDRKCVVFLKSSNPIEVTSLSGSSHLLVIANHVSSQLPLCPQINYPNTPNHSACFLHDSRATSIVIITKPRRSMSPEEA